MDRCTQAARVSQPAASTSGTVWVLWLTGGLAFATLYMTQTMLPVLTESFLVAPTVAGHSLSAVLLAVAVATPVIGQVAHRLGGTTVLRLTTGGLAVVTLLAALAPSFEVLLVARVLQGLLLPGLAVLPIGELARRLPTHATAPAIGGFVSVGVLGGLIGRTVAGVIADLFSWQLVFVLFSLICAGLAVLIVREVPVLPPATVRTAGGRAQAMPRQWGRALGFGLVGGALFFVMVGVFSYLAFYLAQPPFGWSTASSAGLSGLFLLGALTAAHANRMVRHWSSPGLIHGGLLLTALSVISTLLIPTIPGLVLSLGLLCATMFGTHALAAAAANAADGDGATVLYQTIQYLGATLGTLLPGIAYEQWGWPGVVGSSVLVVLGAWGAFWLLVSRTRVLHR